MQENFAIFAKIGGFAKVSCRENVVFDKQELISKLRSSSNWKFVTARFHEIFLLWKFPVLQYLMVPIFDGTSKETQPNLVSQPNDMVLFLSFLKMELEGVPGFRVLASPSPDKRTP